MPLIGTKIRDDPDDAMAGRYVQLSAQVPFRKTRCVACQVYTDREGVQPSRIQAVPLHELSVNRLSPCDDHVVEEVAIEDACGKVAVELCRDMPTLDDFDARVHQLCCHGT